MESLTLYSHIQSQSERLSDQDDQIRFEQLLDKDSNFAGVIEIDKRDCPGQIRLQTLFILWKGAI